jgi:hypothetical protein
MLIKLNNKVGQYDEWCILEFQGQILGNINGKELGKLEIKEVRNLRITFFSLAYVLFCRMEELKWKLDNTF